MEIWRPISGYEGLYEVSNTGRVRRIIHKTFRPQKINGQKVITLTDNHTSITFNLSDVLTSTFPEIKISSPINRVESIRNSVGKSVGQYDFNGNLIRTYDCIRDVKLFGFTPTSVSQCCLGKNGSHRGYIWKFLPKSN